MTARRFIAHLDMDAFFASVELLRYPQLQGHAVVVGGGRHDPQAPVPQALSDFARLRQYVGRGVITTATYPARALGVHSGMGLMKAAALAPDAILLPADFDAYRHYSRLFKATVASMAPLVEDRGIDEIYIDLTDVPGAKDSVNGDPLGGVRALAERMKEAVHQATGLTCSIGITPNKLLSKIASDLNKPNGITLLTMADVPEQIWPLSVSKVNGIGPKATQKLHAMDIETVGDLARQAEHLLIEVFGQSYGRWLHAAAHGRDDRPVVTVREPKSMSRETTFERDLHPRDDRASLTPIFTKLCEQLASDLERKGYVGRTVGIKLRFDDFKIITRSLTMPHPTRHADVIRRWAGRCLKGAPLNRRLRLLGVKMESLVKEDAQLQAAEPTGPYSLSLFDDL